ncbi:MAG: SDR family NAD(P)-dependent oxidoreductase [Promethearchaeota archaeon]
MRRLEGKIAFITGGASGIGRATAELFVKEGSRVLITDIQDEKGKALAEKLGPNAIYQHTNVSQEIDIKNAIDLAVSKWGSLDISVLNAGFGGAMGMIDEISAEGFDLTIGIMLKGVFLGIKHSVPIMREQKSGGSIVNMASIAGLRTGFGGHLYSLCKAAIIQLTKTVAQEVGEHNIRINSVCPGGIPTGIYSSLLPVTDDVRQNITQMLKDGFKDLQPIKRAGTPHDIANACLWLASDEASFVTGIALLIDGGLLTRTFGFGDDEESVFTKLNKAVLGTDDEDKIQELITKEMYRKFK